MGKRRRFCEGGRPGLNKPQSRAAALLALLLIATGVLAGLTASPKPAYACSCAFGSEGSEQIDFADLIFSGTVVKRQDSLPNLLGVRSSGDPVDYVFEVEGAWKGEVREKVTVSTAAGTDACGADFREDYRYIVLAKRSGDKLTTSLCSGNALYLAGTQPDILQKLGEPAEPSAGMSFGTWIRSYLWAVVLFAAATGFGIARLAVRRRRARRQPRA
ncbi:hypothetical protein [Saccharibacillus alkalitolerans]|uniref:Tissue inhibitor of metalloproteinase n=1 Tax=Saccharibacillus alkalitolerans TaxID=2705290 RepID=A0ABX0F3Y3_9BACL|nr:hypothetical protein [Saccharibacillus alkalitolerans]NGZ75661.1 hypothetical protein [Saccharibacillus alkalitolerans]